MDPKQLELDLRPEEREMSAEQPLGGLVVDLEKVRMVKKQKETEQLFRAIIRSVGHINPPNQKYK